MTEHYVTAFVVFNGALKVACRCGQITPEEEYREHIFNAIRTPSPQG